MLSTSALTVSRVRSSRISDSGSESARESDITNSSKPSSVSVEGLEEIMEILRSSGLPGPSIVVGSPEFIGRGGQAVVYSCWVAEPTISGAELFPVAIKHPTFTVDRSKPLQLTDQSAQKHLKDFATEVKALTTPHLHGHPNIVHLFSWSFNQYSVHRPPLLVEELASSDLHKLLHNGGELSHEERHAICSDIASGLDAVHVCGFVHGDLKPSNVLMFRRKGHLVAKLADFGLSIGHHPLETPSIRLRGTQGWEAPEVERGELLTPDGAVRADQFSFGLVAGYALLGYTPSKSDQKTPQRKQHIMSQLEELGLDKLPGHDFLALVEKTVLELLHDNPAKRPNPVQELFSPRESTTTLTSRQLNGDGESQSQELNSRNDGALDPVSQAFMRSMLPHSMRDIKEASPRLLFENFLSMTGDEGRPDSRDASGYSALDVLMVAARRGFPPAQAVLYDALEFYGADIQGEIDTLMLEYLANAVATGSTLARRHLESKNTIMLANSLHRFRASGGYASFYRNKPLAYPLHLLVSGGRRQDLKDYLNKNPDIDFNHPTELGETPIFLACARGAWDIMDELLNAGADATIKCTELGITCLHWVYAFDSIHHGVVIEKLLAAGADINARVSQPLSVFHYPFQLPAGTPLHWAVVTQSHSAIKDLVTHGAALDIRDGCDPYRQDERVRVLGTFSSLNEQAYSFSEVGTQGLSPIDYAALEHDPYLFEIISPHDYNPTRSVDEEGFSALHRLSASTLRRTPSGIAFSFLPFQGGPAQTKGRLKRIVAAVKSLGADLEQLTTPNIFQAQKRQNRGLVKEWERHTPLMLAALSGRPDVVATLLDAGADVNTKNPTGLTALHCISDSTTAATDVCKLLTSAGAGVSSVTSQGVTPLQLAASSRNIEMVDMLLSRGADMEDIKVTEGYPPSGISVLGTLCSTSIHLDGMDENYDRSVAQLLEKWLLHSCDQEKQSRITTRCAPKSGTLLYIFAGALMRHSVAVLISAGSDPNGISLRRQSRAVQGGRMHTTFYETPLDAALNRVEGYKKMQTEIGFPDDTISQYDHICMRADGVIAAIKMAGGKRSDMPKLDVFMPS